MAALRGCISSLNRMFKCNSLNVPTIRYAESHLRYFSGSSQRTGLEEFFPPGVYESGGPGPKEVKTGRRWHASDLRLKSNSDLHKLWYVLLKEMNMLQTVKAEAKRLQIAMPNPERIRKVKASMAMIKIVINERERAVKRIEDCGYQPQFQEDMLQLKEEETDKKAETLTPSSNLSTDINMTSKDQPSMSENDKQRTDLNKDFEKSSYSMT